MSLTVGALSVGRDSADLFRAYEELALRARTRGSRLDVICASKDRVDEVAGSLRASTNLVIRSLDATLPPPTTAGNWQETYSADVLVGDVEALATDYLFESLHAEEPEVTPVRRSMLIMDQADSLLGRSRQWSVSTFVPDGRVHDRIGYTEFPALYEELAGACSRKPDRRVQSRWERLVGQQPSDSIASARRSRSAEHEAIREESAGLEFRQRLLTVADRQDLRTLSGSIAGIERGILRLVSARHKVVKSSGDLAAVMELLELRDTRAGPSAHEAKSSVHRAVLRESTGIGDDELIGVATISACRVYAPLWMQHLEFVDELAGKYSVVPSRDALAQYTHEMYTAHNALRADALATWARYVLGNS